MGKNKTKRKGVNILDLIVLVVFVAILLFAAFKLTGNIHNAGNEKKEVQDDVNFTVEYLSSDPAVLKHIEEGDIVYSGANNEEIGKVKSVHQQPARILVENHDAQAIEYVELPDKVDVVVEIESAAKMEYPDIKVDDFSLKIGKKFDCIIDNTPLHGTIVGMDFDDSLLVKKEEKKK